MALTGHATTTELAKYTKGARRKRMAVEGMALLADQPAAVNKV
jgi:hypothetical protein